MKAKSKDIPDCFIRDVCRATTAVPTFFAPYYFTSMTDDGVTREFNMVDGGVCANNPVGLSCRNIVWRIVSIYFDVNWLVFKPQYNVVY